MSLGEFIMDYGSIIALVVAGLGLLAVVGTVIKEFRDTSRLSKEHENLSREHEKLLQNIDEKLSARHDVRYAEHKQILEKQNNMQQTVTYIKEQAIREQTMKKCLSQE